MWKKLKRQDGNEESFFTLSSAEKKVLLLKSLLVMIILDYFFYQSVWALVPLLGVGIGYYRMERQILYQKKKETAREQFKELILLASVGQKAGYSAENAFLSSYPDMKALFGENSSVCRMIHILKTGKENNRAFFQMWRQLGNQMEIAEITEFAQVYEIAHKSGGNMASVMEKTADIIIHKIETEKEIAVFLSGKRLEQKIMNAMPFLIMLYINITSPGYFRGLYHSPGGVVVMSICLTIYLIAYRLSVRIASIEI